MKITSDEVLEPLNAQFDVKPIDKTTTELVGTCSIGGATYFFVERVRPEHVDSHQEDMRRAMRARAEGKFCIGNYVHIEGSSNRTFRVTSINLDAPDEGSAQCSGYWTDDASRATYPYSKLRFIK